MKVFNCDGDALYISEDCLKEVNPSGRLVS